MNDNIKYVPARVFAPSHFSGICVQVIPRDMMVCADLSASQAAKEAFGLIGAGFIFQISGFMVDPLYGEVSRHAIPM